MGRSPRRAAHGSGNSTAPPAPADTHTKTQSHEGAPISPSPPHLFIPSSTPTPHRSSKPHSILPCTPQRPDRRSRRRRMPCLARSAWPGLRCPAFVPVSIDCSLCPTRQRKKAAACPALPAPKKHAHEDAKIRRHRVDQNSVTLSSPHPVRRFAQASQSLTRPRHLSGRR